MLYYSGLFRVEDHYNKLKLRMKKSNIILAVLAGAAIGGIVAIILKAEHELLNSNEDNANNSSFKKIAQQFSNKLSLGLKTAESKIKAGVKSNEFSKHDEEGVFL